MTFFVKNVDMLYYDFLFFHEIYDILFYDFFCDESNLCVSAEGLRNNSWTTSGKMEPRELRTRGVCLCLYTVYVVLIMFPHCIHDDNCVMWLFVVQEEQ